MNIQSLIKVALVATFPLLSIASQAFDTVEFSSTKQKTAILQLFTSEGCSSCPVADKWLSKLQTHPKLFEDFIPLAFHVNYWDYIGWKDPFASAEFSERHRNLKRQNLITRVYTPGLVFNDELWNSWFRGNKTVPTITEKAKVLSVQYDGEKLTVDYPENKKGMQMINVSFFAMGLENDVKRGENRGKTLHHDFTVVQHKQFERTGQDYSLALPKGYEKLGLAVWISQGDSLISEQAVGGYLEI